MIVVLICKSIRELRSRRVRGLSLLEVESESYLRRVQQTTFNRRRRFYKFVSSEKVNILQLINRVLDIIFPLPLPPPIPSERQRPY